MLVAVIIPAPIAPAVFPVIPEFTICPVVPAALLRTAAAVWFGTTLPTPPKPVVTAAPMFPP